LETVCTVATVAMVQTLNQTLDKLKADPAEQRNEIRKLIGSVKLSKQLRGELLQILDDIDNPPPPPAVPTVLPNRQQPKPKVHSSVRPKAAGSSVITEMPAQSGDSETTEETTSTGSDDEEEHEAPATSANLVSRTPRPEAARMPTVPLSAPAHSPKKGTTKPASQATKPQARKDPTNLQASKALAQQIDAVRTKLDHAKQCDDFERCIQLRDQLQSLIAMQEEANQSTSKPMPDQKHLQQKLMTLLDHQTRAQEFLNTFDATCERVRQQNVPHQELHELEQMEQILEQQKQNRLQQLLNDDELRMSALEQMSVNCRQGVAAMPEVLVAVKQMETKSSICMQHEEFAQQLNENLSNLKACTAQSFQNAASTYNMGIEDDRNFVQNCLQTV